MKQIIFILFLGCIIAGGYLALSGGTQNLNKVDWETVTVRELKVMIMTGADINARNTSGATPLMLAAAQSKDPAVIETLIKAGADVNARDDAGRTPLMWAKRFNKTGSIIDALVKAAEESSN